MTTTVDVPVRLAVDDLAPHMMKAMSALDAASRKTTLEPALLELVRARASQLNGCVINAWNRPGAGAHAWALS